MSHLSSAELPRMTYSLPVSLSYGCSTTAGDKCNVSRDQSNDFNFKISFGVDLRSNFWFFRKEIRRWTLPDDSKSRTNSPLRSETIVQDTTRMKSATNDGMTHLSSAELPRMTYSLAASLSYGCSTTVGQGHVISFISMFKSGAAIEFQETRDVIGPESHVTE